MPVQRTRGEWASNTAFHSSPGTAAPSGSPGANAQNTAPAGGIGKPTTTNQQDSDAKIDQENKKADKTVGKICKKC
ncbi:flagellar biosynthesis/type III secretory pathway M-ring protein FliF/YscJ [Bradyrhizobium sp. LB1.3]